MRRAPGAAARPPPAANPGPASPPSPRRAARPAREGRRWRSRAARRVTPSASRRRPDSCAGSPERGAWLAGGRQAPGEDVARAQSGDRPPRALPRGKERAPSRRRRRAARGASRRGASRSSERGRRAIGLHRRGEPLRGAELRRRFRRPPARAAHQHRLSRAEQPLLPGERRAGAEPLQTQPIPRSGSAPRPHHVVHQHVVVAGGVAGRRRRRGTLEPPSARRNWPASRKRSSASGSSARRSASPIAAFEAHGAAESERPAAGEHLEPDGAERIEIGARISGIAGEHLRRDVPRSPGGGSFHGQAATGRGSAPDRSRGPSPSPPSVRKTFCGFRSRCTTPWQCAARSAAQTSLRDPAPLRAEDAAAQQPLVQGAAPQQLHG